MNALDKTLMAVCALVLVLSSCDNSTVPALDATPIEPTPIDTPVDPPPVDAPDVPVAEPTLWEPARLHVYTFAADLPRDEWSDETARDVWQFSEGSYDDMLRRVGATIESHSRNHPGDELKVVAGGL